MDEGAALRRTTEDWQIRTYLYLPVLMMLAAESIKVAMIVINLEHARWMLLELTSEHQSSIDM